MTLAVVTATIDYPRAKPLIRGWFEQATWSSFDLYVVGQGGFREGWHDTGVLHLYGSPTILGVVPAFAIGVAKALQDGADVIACFHDDLEIHQTGWDDTVVKLFKACPRAGLAGFGGARGLGDDDLYQTPYRPMQLARKTFGSNMRDAEAHGLRWESAQPVACLDGFAQIGLATFWSGFERVARDEHEHPTTAPSGWNLFHAMQHLGVVHHFYDGMLGCYAKRLGYQVWFLPVYCHHHGGLTAVADPRYHDWANQYKDQLNRMDAQGPAFDGTGDQMFWEAAHRIGYTHFRDVLPLRT